jgi:hypothetical protein
MLGSIPGLFKRFTNTISVTFYVQEWKDALEDSEELLKLLTPAVRKF